MCRYVSIVTSHCHPVLNLEFLAHFHCCTFPHIPGNPRLILLRVHAESVSHTQMLTERAEPGCSKIRTTVLSLDLLYPDPGQTSCYPLSELWPHWLSHRKNSELTLRTPLMGLCLCCNLFITGVPSLLMLETPGQWRTGCPEFCLQAHQVISCLTPGTKWWGKQCLNLQVKEVLGAGVTSAESGSYLVCS